MRCATAFDFHFGVWNEDENRWIFTYYEWTKMLLLRLLLYDFWHTRTHTNRKWIRFFTYKFQSVTCVCLALCIISIHHHSQKRKKEMTRLSITHTHTCVSDLRFRFDFVCVTAQGTKRTVRWTKSLRNRLHFLFRCQWFRMQFSIVRLRWCISMECWIKGGNLSLLMSIPKSMHLYFLSAT